VYGLAVEAMSVHVELSGEDCHFTMLPVWRESDIEEVPPLHTVVGEAAAVPPTEVASTMTEIE
jgi:hypothetical protein